MPTLKVLLDEADHHQFYIATYYIESSAEVEYLNQDLSYYNLRLIKENVSNDHSKEYQLRSVIDNNNFSLVLANELLYAQQHPIKFMFKQLFKKA